LNALNKDNYTTVVDYPIDIIYDKEEFMAVEKLPSRVKIEINGDKILVEFQGDLKDSKSSDFYRATDLCVKKRYHDA
jgi:YbbR domain-containing protein